MDPDLSGLDILFRLLAVFLLVLANGFFVAAEFSLVSVRRTRIDELVREGRPLAREVRRAIADLDGYLAATQLGITMASIGLGWIGEPALAAMFESAIEGMPLTEGLPDWLPFVTSHGLAVAVAFAVITGLHIVLGELAPKTIAIQKPEKTALFIALPIHWFLVLFKPFIHVLNGLGRVILRLFGFEPVAAGHLVAHSEEELKMIVTQSTMAGVLAPVEEELIHRIFEFADLTANQIMIPRTEIVALPLAVDRDRLERTLAGHGFTRYPIYDGSLDNVVGVVNVKDLIPLLTEPDGPIDLRPVMRAPLVLPESIRVFRLLEAMQGNRKHIVILIDEFGGTAGMVALRDVLERIVGEVRSEKEAQWPDVEMVSEHEALVDGLVLVQDVNERLGLELDEEEYDTIGGYAFGHLGRRAETGDVVEAPGCRLVVEGLDGMRISRLRIVVEEPAARGARPDDR
jgi:CBS domain containing-hemolysin-like protein